MCQVLFKRRRILALLGAAFLPLPAHAHGAFGSAAPFWSGALHVVVNPLALAAIAGLAATLAITAEASTFWSICTAAFSAAMAAQWLPPTWITLAPIGVIGVGLMAALAVKPSPLIAYPAGIAAGLAVGLSVDVDARSLGAALGVGMVVIVLTTWGLEIFLRLEQVQRLKTVVPIARRVIGAWVAAIALLLGALTLSQTVHPVAAPVSPASVN